MTIAILLVTCCLEQSRFETLEKVVENIKVDCPPEWCETMTVFDNASTHPGMDGLLKNFAHVYRADKNVGYWSAIDWWLTQLTSQQEQPTYTYIIESDIIHYAAGAIEECAKFLDTYPDIGSVRLHEYSVENMRYYNKDQPMIGSRKNVWQSHTNKVTGEGVVHHKVEGNFWRTNWLSHLPALNRYTTMCSVFAELRALGQFTELDFQRLYHRRYPKISFVDGGIMTCKQDPYDKKQVTGSWSSPQELKRLGYLSTRYASIVSADQYTATKV